MTNDWDKKLAEIQINKAIANSRYAYAFKATSNIFHLIAGELDRDREYDAKFGWSMCGIGFNETAGRGDEIIPILTRDDFIDFVDYGYEEICPKLIMCERCRISFEKKYEP
jgi:hypothetical protein